MIRRRSVSLLFLVSSLICDAADGACSKTHPYVGFEAPLVNTQDQVGGTVVILDDCTFEVQQFSYDGAAPSAFWWGSSNVSQIDNGFKLSSTQVVDAADGLSTVVVPLNPGLTWDSIGELGLYCTDFLADLGHVALQSAKSQAAAAAATPPPSAQPAALSNCVPLTGKYYSYWELDNATPSLATSVRVMLEGKVGPGYWMGFGFNNPNFTEVMMPGSDVAIVGMVGTDCFAIDYYLQSRVQCDYASGQNTGVCPDAGLGMTAADNNVKLLSCSYTDGITRVEFERPLKAHDKFDWAWPVGAAQPTTWAMGPLSDGSTIQTPVVLYHQIDGEEINAPPNFFLDLGQAQNNCTTPVSGASATQVAGNVSTISGATTFTVVTGPNPNYPNPPAWGLSYHVNGQESPLLEVVRGTEYTFIVEASDQHPLYITTSPLGGAGRGLNPGEMIFAGGDDSYGTLTQPYTLKWTPNTTAPGTLYYQCHTHQKLGWKIQVLDSSTAIGTTGGSGTAAAAPAPAPANALNCTKTVSGNTTTYAACASLAAVFNGGYYLYWTLDQKTSQLSVAYSSAVSDGFLGWGVPQTPGLMLGGNAVIVRTNASSPTGASVNDFHLGGYTPSAVLPPSQLTFLDKRADYTAGVLSAAFTLNLSAADAAQTAEFNIIYSQGPLDANGGLQPHPVQNGMAAQLDLDSGSGSTAVTDTTVVQTGINNPKVHGYLSAICFALLLPLSVVLARGFKEYNPAWFHLHRVLGTVAWIGGVIGASFGQRLHDRGLAIPTSHRVIGWIVVALVTLQLSAFAIRPSLTHALRRVWNAGHFWAGRIAIGLAIANVYVGLHQLNESAKVYWGFSVLLGAIVVLGLLKEAIDAAKLGWHHTSMQAKGVVAGDSDKEYPATQRRHGHVGAVMDRPEQGGWLVRDPPPPPAHVLLNSSGKGDGARTGAAADGSNNA